ncbi:glycosyltransferase [uncultured Aliivibrio sp.]|uniref:glycosyltransferase n=1 Tax=uncultured Aliivibrio sp. TaxID=873085 RepID=UPI0026135644|nr:glycosyltransferase [uncultured Aliivibrio sp.]
MNVAVLICTYCKDSNEHLNEMFASVFASDLPTGINVRLYLHIDGEICIEKEKVISNYPIYKILKSSNNVGLAKGLNKLIATIEDESYLFRMDADDLQASDRFINQIEFMEENTGIDFSGGSITEFEGNQLNVVQKRSYPSLQEGIISTVSRSSPFAHVTVCFRKGFFEKFGNYPESYPLNEDIAFWLQSLKLGAKGANIEQNCVFVRMDGAYSRRSYSKAVNEFKVFNMAAKWNKSGRIYPFLRFMFRLLPNNLVQKVYHSKCRNFFLER